MSVVHLVNPYHLVMCETGWGSCEYSTKDLAKVTCLKCLRREKRLLTEEIGAIEAERNKIEKQINRVKKERQVK